MVTTEFRVWREVDNRAKDEKFLAGMQDEIEALRREVRRLTEKLTPREDER